MKTLSVRSIARDCLGVTPPFSVGEVFGARRSGAGRLSLRGQLTYVDAKGVLPHPFMARRTNSMHEDAAATDVSTASGLRNATATTWRYFKYTDIAPRTDLAMIPTLTFDSRGRILGIGAKGNKDRQVRQLLLIDPHTLEVLASHDLPAPSTGWGHILTFLTNPDKLFTDTSGGAYFFLDHRDWAIIPTTDRRIAVVAISEGSPGSRPVLRRVDTIDLRYDAAVRPQGIPDSDKLAVVLPDWHQPDCYWFTSSDGMVGIVSGRGVRSVSLRSMHDPDERITNGFAVGRKGAFIVSDHALYRFERTASGAPRMVWRYAYTRGEKKPGQLGPGSGTTPTLLADKYVAFCDNDEPMQVLIVDQEPGVDATGVEVCRSKAFDASQSACEISLIGYKFGVVVVNTYGYKSPFSGGSDTVGGMTRIDVDPQTGRCLRRWTRSDITGTPLNIWSTVPKLSSPDRVIYAYTREDRGRPSPVWVVLGVDYDTGRNVFSLDVSEPERKRILGANLFESPGDLFRRGDRIDIFDNSWGPVYLGLNEWGKPSLLISMIEGFLKVDLAIAP